MENNRQLLYSIFPLKQMCEIYFRNQNRNLKIKGYVESIEGDIFTKQEEIQISIICPNPYFEGVNIISSSIERTVSIFEFPFSISEAIPFGNVLSRAICYLENVGDVECGCIFKFHFCNSADYLRITNEVTQEYMCFQNIQFNEGDELYINTNFGNLSAILKQSEGEKNMIPFLKKGSSWIRLATGMNTLTYSVGEKGYDTVSAQVEFIPLYGGV